MNGEKLESRRLLKLLRATLWVACSIVFSSSISSCNLTPIGKKKKTDESTTSSSSSSNSSRQSSSSSSLATSPIQIHQIVELASLPDGSTPIFISNINGEFFGHGSQNTRVVVQWVAVAEGAFDGEQLLGVNTIEPNLIKTTIPANIVQSLSQYDYTLSFALQFEGTPVSQTEFFPHRFTKKEVSQAPESVTHWYPVERMICLHHPHIPSLFGSEFSPVYDFQQSRREDLIYGISYFTHNLAESLETFRKSFPSGGNGAPPPVECLAPENYAYNDETLNRVRSGSLYRDLPKARVFSAAGDPQTGSHLIFPSALIKNGTQEVAISSSFDRSRFSVFKERTSTFSRALATRNSPGQSPKIVGYGVIPIDVSPSGGGVFETTSELCPDSPNHPLKDLRIPPNHQWVKVWQYSKNLPDRSYASTQAFEGITIACRPSNLPNNHELLVGASKGLPGGAFHDCASALPSGVIQNRAITFSNSSGDPQGAFCAKTSPGRETSSTLASATDQWERVRPTQGNILPDEGWLFACENTLSLFQRLGLTTSATTGFCSRNTASAPASAIFDNSPGTVPIPNSRSTDVLYVVTPTSVRTDQLVTPGSPESDLYAPIRFENPSDCPDPTRFSECRLNRAIRYELHLTEQGSSNANVVFPICAIQEVQP